MNQRLENCVMQGRRTNLRSVSGSKSCLSSLSKSRERAVAGNDDQGTFFNFATFFKISSMANAHIMLIPTVSVKELE